MPVFTLRAKFTQWGDYGKILIHGMSKHVRRRDGIIQLERTGPFVPMITFPGGGDVVVTDTMRRLLETSGLDGPSFVRVDKHRIVQSDWETWDRNAAEPQVYPSTTEPEDYVLGQAHDPRLADMIGDLWELVAPVVGSAQIVEIIKGPLRFRVVASLPAKPPDVFRCTGVRLFPFVTAGAKAWLEQRQLEWVEFDPVELDGERLADA